MRLEQKLRIVESNNLNIIIKDETGFANEYNPLGYRDNLEKVHNYIFIVEDLIRRVEYRFYKSNTDPIQYGVELSLIPEEGKYPDSLYNVQMYTTYGIQMEGDGFKGEDFISNVAGADSIGGNYSAIIVGDDVYKIVSVKKGLIFLDRILKTDVDLFDLGFYDEKKTTLYSDLQDKIIKATEQLKCCDKTEDINKLASIHLYLKGIEEATLRGSYETALGLLKYVKSISKHLTCNKC